MNWRPFYRRASASHRLEAKIAVGSESYGHNEKKLVAKKGQWLCRNPENGHIWIMSDGGMEELYRPVDSDDKEWLTLMAKVKPKKTQKSVSAKKSTEKLSLSFDPAEAGPLFFDEDGSDGKKEYEEK